MYYADFADKGDLPITTIIMNQIVSAFGALVLSLPLSGTARADITASFDCEKASSKIEKLICSDEDLAELDTWLGEAYSRVLSDKTKAGKAKEEQRHWLREIRNACSDGSCLKAVYTERLNQLEPPITFDQPEIPSPGNPKTIVLGRCHMESCWWWGLDEVNPLQSEPEGKLVNVKVRTSSESYSRVYIKMHDYPDKPPFGALWGNEASLFLLCSTDVPLILTPEVSGSNGLRITYPFSEDGSVSGSTEGIANLYSAVCPEHPISSEASLRQLAVERVESPMEVFTHITPQSK